MIRNRQPRSLTRVALLKDIPQRILKAAEKEAAWFSLPGGWTLFEENDNADYIYFVLSGSLGAFRRAPDGRSEFIGHIRAGEPVGEMAMLASEPHSNSVYALRDCEMIRLSRPAFMRMVRSAPDIMERLTRIILIRLRQSRRRNLRAEPKVFALVSASRSIDLTARAKSLASSLEAIGRRAIVVGAEASERNTEYFDALEAEYDAVILTAPIEYSPWFQLALRQADRVWVLARADAKPSIPLMPTSNSPAKRFRLIDVVLISHKGTRPASTPNDWLDAADAARIFHWRGTDGNDCLRLARVMAGRSIGVVFSGGGARAYAHIGALRALREAGMNIDFIGGSSMGAVVAACYARGWSDAEIETRIRKGFVESNPLGDYNLPVVALVKGKRVDKRLKEHFGDLDISEMRIPFFAVSTNLTDGTYRVHTRGSLRHALRASIALPGILPPLVDDGEVLVDGAVLNNFPVDVMRDLHRGFIIGCDVARAPQGLSASDFVNPPDFLGWITGHGLSAPPIASLLMRSATISVNPNQGRELTDLLIAPKLEDTDLRDWKNYDKVVEHGYNATRKAIAESKGPISRVLRPTSEKPLKSLAAG